MDITITVTVTDGQRDAILAMLRRSGSADTPAQLVQRLIQKMLNGWVRNHRQELQQRNQPAMLALHDQIVDDPNCDAILASMGWRLVNGALERIT
jgi:hypothetical protein